MTIWSDISATLIICQLSRPMWLTQTESLTGTATVGRQFFCFFSQRIWKNMSVHEHSWSRLNVYRIPSTWPTFCWIGGNRLHQTKAEGNHPSQVSWLLWLWSPQCWTPRSSSVSVFSSSFPTTALYEIRINWTARQGPLEDEPGNGAAGEKILLFPYTVIPWCIT